MIPGSTMGPAPTPPTHGQIIAVALILDAIVLFGVVFTWLTIRATARPACTCQEADRGA